MFYKSKNKTKQIKQNYKLLMLVGFFGALALLFQMSALKYTLVGYVSSIRSSNIIIAVLIGYFIFKEENVDKRLVCAILMFIGVLLIILD
ncbi:MAG: EamA family transporter [Methanobacteriaceae archaeon]|nr:EamA family transporter [Methanobacteriaceae archaeon]